MRFESVRFESVRRCPNNIEVVYRKDSEALNPLTRVRIPSSIPKYDNRTGIVINFDSLSNRRKANLFLSFVVSNSIRL